MALIRQKKWGAQPRPTVAPPCLAATNYHLSGVGNWAPRIGFHDGIEHLRSAYRHRDLSGVERAPGHLVPLMVQG